MTDKLTPSMPNSSTHDSSKLAPAHAEPIASRPAVELKPAIDPKLAPAAAPATKA